MPKNQIYCKKCNAKFKSMIDFIHHSCPNEETAPKWGKSIGRNTSENKIHNQYMDDHWLVQTQREFDAFEERKINIINEQRKKAKTRPVYKKNYKRHQS